MEIGSIFVIVGTAKSGILPHIQIMYYPDTSKIRHKEQCVILVHDKQF